MAGYKVLPVQPAIEKTCPIPLAGQVHMDLAIFASLIISCKEICCELQRASWSPATPEGSCFLGATGWLGQLRCGRGIRD